jgi:hypothetical protein
MDTAKEVRQTFPTDFWGAWPMRAAAWAHTLGEACINIAPRASVPLSIVTGAYVLFSAVDRGRRGREVERFPDLATLVGRKVTCENILTQWAGLVYLPSAIVGGASSLVAGTFRRYPTMGQSLGRHLSPRILHVLPAALPLLLVPLTLPVSEALSEAAADWALRPFLDSFWPTAVSLTPQCDAQPSGAPSEADFAAWQEMTSDERRMLAWALDGDEKSPFPEGDPAPINRSSADSGAPLPAVEPTAAPLSVAELRWLEAQLTASGEPISVPQQQLLKPPGEKA